MFSSAIGNSGSKRFNGICDHCKINSHKLENCYRLIGYPVDFKFTMKKGSQMAVTANTKVTETSNFDSKSVDLKTALIALVTTPLFTQEQYNQILSLLNKNPFTDSVVHVASNVSHYFFCH